MNPGTVRSVCCVVGNLELGGVPRLYADVLGRFGRRGLDPVTVIGPDGPARPFLEEAGVAWVAADWSADRAESYSVVDEVARDHDAAIVMAEGPLVHAVPAAAAAAGRVLLAFHTDADLVSTWSRAAKRELDAVARALIHAPEGAVMVRGRAPAEHVSALLRVAEDELSIVEPGIATDRISFDPSGGDPGTVLVLSRLAPDVEPRLRAGVELVAAGRAQGRECRLLLVGDGPARDEALELCGRRLEDGAWRYEPGTRDPIECIRQAGIVVATNLTALEAMAVGRRVVLARRVRDDGGALGLVVTESTYPLLRDDIFSMNVPRHRPEEIWEALDAAADDRTVLRDRVASTHSAERQADEILEALNRLSESGSPQLVGSLGELVASIGDELCAPSRQGEGRGVARPRIPPRPVERVILHIGTHKTGTSAIQASLVQASDRLLAHGVLYPSAGRSGPGQAGLAREVAHSTGPVRDVPSHLALLEEVRDVCPSTLILSSEGFTYPYWPTGRPVEWASALCAELEPREVEVLAYVRPQWEYIESLYTQRVKTGQIWMPFEDYVDESLREGFRFEYPRVFGSWRDAFEGRLVIRPYSPQLLLGGEAVGDFWHSTRLGAPPASMAKDDGNHRPGVIATEMLRTLRSLMAEYHLDTALDVQATLRRAHAQVATALPYDPRFSALTPEAIARIADHFSSSNEEFAQAYLQGRHGSLFDPPSELAQVAPAWSLGSAAESERRLFAEVVHSTLGEASGAARSTGGGKRAKRASTERAKRQSRPSRPLRRAAERLRARVRLRTRLGLRN